MGLLNLHCRQILYHLSHHESPISGPVFIKWCVHTCMLSHFTHVRLFVTLLTMASKAPLSMGFPRQEYWLLMLLLSRFSRVRLCATPETAAHQAPPSLGFSRQEYWSGLQLPFPGDLPDPGIEPIFLISPELSSTPDSLPLGPPGKPPPIGASILIDGSWLPIEDSKVIPGLKRQHGSGHRMHSLPVVCVSLLIR